MNRYKSILAASVLALGASTFAAVAQERVVNVYNWSDYIDEALLEKFEAETGQGNRAKERVTIAGSCESIRFH